MLYVLTTSITHSCTPFLNDAIIFACISVWVCSGIPVALFGTRYVAASYKNKMNLTYKWNL